MLADLLDRFRRHDRHALARLLTLIARGESLKEIRAVAEESDHPGRVIAITGGGGVGKSTLIGKLLERFRRHQQTVAVLACDPQSPLSGGALLGDRFRMPSRPDDDGVFIRSLAAAGGHEGLAENLEVMVQLLQAFGFDRVLVETVGVGQGDVAVRRLADVVVLLLQPEAGDDIQWEKAGLLEIADVVVVHKADLPGAERMEAQVRGLLHLPGCREVPVLRVSAAREQGLDELYRLIEELPSRRLPEGGGPALLRLAQQRLAERFQQQTERVGPLLQRWQSRDLTDSQAADEVLRLVSGE
jgi:LAO/AO transport system ATPase